MMLKKTDNPPDGDNERPEIPAAAVEAQANQPATHVAISLALLNDITQVINKKLFTEDGAPLLQKIQKEALPINMTQQVSAPGMNGA